MRHYLQESEKNSQTQGHPCGYHSCITCRRAAIFLATSGVGVAKVHLSFRVALAMSALAMDITIWGKLEGE